MTVYLLVGLALGPQVLLRFYDAGGLAGHLLLGPVTEAPLEAVSQLAVGFILFGIGAEFRFATFRRVGLQALVFSGTEITVTALLVGVVMWFGTGDWRLAVIAPALAIATAPSATLVTLREVEAEGPATRALMLSVGHNNLAALLSFPLLVALAFGGGQTLSAMGLAAGAIAAGVAIGLGGAIFLEALDDRRELVLLGIVVVLATLGISHWMAPASTGLGMLGCFAAGVALSNSSPHADQVLRYVENTVYPLYVLFFIGAGRDLHIEALAGAGGLGVLFIAARAGGKLAGSRLGLALAGWRDELPKGFGAGLLCQAGVALGLVAALEVIAPDATAGLRDIVIASVVVFELIGPWLVRRTVVSAGEVKLANLVPHPEATGAEAVRWVALELLRNLGLLGGRPTKNGNGDGPSVEHAMRRRPDVLTDELPFARVLKKLAETHADLLPVLDKQGRFKGVISYGEVKNVLYDPLLRDLVVAADLTTPVAEPLAPEDSLPAALELMDRHQVHSWPVVREGQLLGVLRRSDAYALMRRGLSAGKPARR